MKEIGKDALYYMPAKIIPALVGFAGMAVYPRLLGPKEYGIYVLITVTISFVHIFAFSWVEPIILRYFEKYKNDRNISMFLSTVGITKALIFAVVTVLCFLFTLFFPSYFEERFAYLAKIAIFVLAVQVGYTGILAVLRANRESLRYSIYASVYALGTLLLSIGLIIFLWQGAEGIMLATVVLGGGIFSIEMRQIYKKWKISPYFFSIKLLRKLRSFGLFQIGISVGAWILSMFDRYMIEAFKGTEQVGIYSAGYNIASMSIQAPLSILMLAALPIIVHTFEASGEHDTKLLFKKVFSLYFIILVPAVFGIAALSKEIVSIMLGQPFVSAAIILAWIAGASFFFGISQYLSIPFQLKEKLHVLFYLIIAGGIMNIILNFILIPPLGILGAAYATLIAYFIYCVASYLAIREILALSFPWIVLAKSLVASTIMYLTLNYISELLAHNITSFISEVSIGVVVYFLTLMLLKERTFLNGVQPFVNSMRNILKIRLR